MKIILAGGGTGGHFYPLIAVAEKLKHIAKEEKLAELSIFYLSNSPYDERLLFDNNISYRYIPAGKMRIYFSFRNFLDIFKTLFGIIKAIITVFSIFPDVIFSKGGYASIPIVFAGRMFNIPIVMHESDSVPGRSNLWTSKFAHRIATSYPDSNKVFPEEKTAWTGNPIREDMMKSLSKEEAGQVLNLSHEVPTILVTGGSLGSVIINENIIGILSKLVENYQVIHQTGLNNFKDVEGATKIVLENSPFKDRYRPFPYLDLVKQRASFSLASLVISRAGSTIFEIASLGIPSIIIPITESNGDHQRKNAYSYANSGASMVIEEVNLRSHILLSEIEKLMSNPEKLIFMSKCAKEFSKPDASTKIAREIINIALKHEK